jgi:NitT/TauT family transport system ATP-binding protein
MSAAVTLRDVSKVFAAPHGGARVHALGPIDLTLRAGEFFAVVGPSGRRAVGPSGCGKSTLFELIAGLSRASTGGIVFEGHSIAGGVPDGVGVVFQEDSCLPWRTVRANVELGLRRMRLTAAERDARVDRVLALMNLREFAGTYPAQLSGGMRQRVCIARTLVMEPRLILLDEPFAALDQQTRLLMGEEVLRLCRATNATVFLITHALDEAAMLADRIGVMSARPGRIIDVVETHWPRERDSRIIEHAEFGTITARLWKTLREESMKTIGRAGGAATGA